MHSGAGLTDPFVVSMEMMAIDGTRVYWANTGNGVESPFTSFVATSDLTSGVYTQFSAQGVNSGQGVCLNYRASSADCYSSQW